MKTFLTLFVLLFSSSVVAGDEIQLYVSVTDNLPPVNIENEVYMGDKMVEQRTGMFLECLVPKFSDSDKN